MYFIMSIIGLYKHDCNHVIVIIHLYSNRNRNRLHLWCNRPISEMTGLDDLASLRWLTCFFICTCAFI